VDFNQKRTFKQTEREREKIFVEMKRYPEQGKKAADGKGKRKGEMGHGGGNGLW